MMSTRLKNDLLALLDGAIYVGLFFLVFFSGYFLLSVLFAFVESG
jgi:hypothetical protein